MDYNAVEVFTKLLANNFVLTWSVEYTVLILFFSTKLFVRIFMKTSAVLSIFGLTCNQISSRQGEIMRLHITMGMSVDTGTGNWNSEERLYTFL